MAGKRNTKRVDLRGLFLWKNPLVIKDDGGKDVGEVYQRILNDKDQERARLTAVRHSRDTRKALRDESSSEFASFSESLESYNNEQLISITLVGKFPATYKTAVDLAKTTMPNTPKEESTAEETEEYEALVDTFDERLNKESMAIVERLNEEEKKKLVLLSEEDLKTAAKEALLNQICSSAASEKFGEWQAYLSTYEDPEYTLRYFDSFEEFEDLAFEVKTQLVKGYRALLSRAGDLKN